MNGRDGQHLHHMLTRSPWDHSHLFKLIQKRSFVLMKRRTDPAYLLIDEVGFRKKGKHSACVGNQYLGSIGKHDNGQVAVSAALSSTEFYCPIEMKLFMPKDWQDDEPRRIAAGIPSVERHQTKTQMALEMIRRLYKKIPSSECVVFDALYGGNIDLLEKLIGKKIPFVGDVKKSQRIYLKEPRLDIPPYTGCGRKHFLKRTNKKPIQLQHYLQTLNKNNFKSIKLRKGTKGFIKAGYHSRKVWVHHKLTNSFLPLQLLIRKETNGDVKFSLCFFLQEATTKRLAKAQGQRVFVERIFEEGKNIVGMGDYQTRSWTGFHRHISLTSLALLFLMEKKITLQPIIGRISAYHIQELINATLATLSLHQVINKLLYQIPHYQKQIINNLKCVT